METNEVKYGIRFEDGPQVTSNLFYLWKGNYSVQDCVLETKYMYWSWMCDIILVESVSNVYITPMEKNEIMSSVRML